MGGDWQHLAQSIFLGLIFSYLLAKLISILFSFKEENLTITRSPPSSAATAKRPHPESISAEAEAERETTDSVIAEHGSVRNDSVLGSDDDDDDDSDWEGVESTELDEVFSAATAFIATAAADRLSKAVSNDVQLQLYGLYKIATEGPCSTPQPSALKMTARAKWQAWNKLGAMPTEEAMQKYIDIVTELYPSWLDGLSMKRKAGDAPGSSTESKGPMGPVFSTFVFEESGGDMKMDAIHDFAREGDVNDLLKCIESGVSVNIKDSEGRTPLHWAVDRGNLAVVELLVSKDADINAKDNEGQTPLHYAAVCEHEEIAQFLLKHDASKVLKDNDGKLASDLCDSNWPWLQDLEKSDG